MLVLADSLRFQKPTNAKPETVSVNFITMIKYLVLIFFLFITNNIYSEIPQLIDSINYESEKASIDSFVHNFTT